MEEKNKYFNEGEVPFEQQDIPKGEEKEPNIKIYIKKKLEKIFHKILKNN